MFRFRSDESHTLSFWILVMTVVALGLVVPIEVRPQSSSSDVGNGGRHTIQGRLYVANGRRSEIAGLKIRLNNSSAGDTTIISDESGTFTFRGLGAGSYTVTIQGGDHFEDHVENVVIDDVGSSNIRTTMRMGSIPRTMNLQVYLRPKVNQESARRASVINAKWVNVPKAAMESFERGIRLEQEDREKDAESALRQAVDLYPSFAPAHTALGRVLQKIGNLNEAISEWRLAIRYDSADFDAHINLGIAYLNLKKLAEAEPHLVQAAFLEPTAVTPHYYIGIEYVMKNDLDVAMKAFEKAKELNGGKSLPALHKYLGRIYSAKNMRREAITELETYLKLVPKAQDAEKVRKDISDIKQN